MEDKTRKTRVELDTLHSLVISVNEAKRTVIAELVVCNGEPDFIYAESFSVPCNYLRTAIKKGIAYIDGSTNNSIKTAETKKSHKNSFLSG